MEGLSAWFSEATECHSDCDPLVVVVEWDLLFFPEQNVFFEFEGFEVFCGGFFCVLFWGWCVGQGVGGAVRVDVWVFVVADDSESCYVFAGFVYGEAELLHFFFEGVEVGFMLGMVGSCYGDDGKEASAADGESGVVDVWDLCQEFFGGFRVGEVVEVEDDEGVVVGEAFF